MTCNVSAHQLPPTGCIMKSNNDKCVYALDNEDECADELDRRTDTDSSIESSSSSSLYVSDSFEDSESDETSSANIIKNNLLGVTLLVILLHWI